MGEIKIDTKKLNAAVEEINGLEVEGVEKIRVVGISNINKALMFIDAVAAISEVDEELLSDAVVEFYNEGLPTKKDLVEAGAAAPKAKKGKAKGEPKAKKEPKPVVPPSRYGHQQKAKSGQLDDALFEGGTIEEIMANLGVPRSRFQSHVKHLKDDCGLTIIVTADKDKNTKLDHYKVKEEKYTPPAK